MRRGGHDAQKVYAAFHRANSHTGQPSVLLVKTVKGWGMGSAGEGKNTAHQAKKLSDEKAIPLRISLTTGVDPELKDRLMQVCGLEYVRGTFTYNFGAH